VEVCVVVNMAKGKQWEDVQLLSFDLPVQTVEFTIRVSTYHAILIYSITLLMSNVGLYTPHLLQGPVTDRRF
jgi:hypothetical protein